MNVSQPDTGAAWKSVGVDQGDESDLDEEDIETLADALEAIREKHDLKTVDLYAALDHLEGRRSE